MPGDRIKIGVMAPGSRIDETVAERVGDIAAGFDPDRSIDIHFHPQCFLASGHFAGDDATRTEAFLDIANHRASKLPSFAR